MSEGPDTAPPRSPSCINWPRVLFRVTPGHPPFPSCCSSRDIKFLCNINTHIRTRRQRAARVLFLLSRVGSPQLRRHDKKPSATAATEISFESKRERAFVRFCRTNLPRRLAMRLNQTSSQGLQALTSDVAGGKLQCAREYLTNEVVKQHVCI